MPGKHPDKETQEGFIRNIYRFINRAQNSDDIVVFLDPTHQLYNVVNGYCWQEKGKSNTKVFESNSGRKRVTIMGALNPLELKPTAVVTEDNCDKETMCRFLEELRNAYQSADTIYALLDNARYNHAKLVKRKAEDLGIELIYLPAYSPNLNLIERLWKFLKKKLKKNVYYNTFKKFLNAIYDFFKSIDDYREELEKLLTLNFEII